MAKKKENIPQYGTTMRNGIQYYRTRIVDADGKQVSLYAKTREELYEKESEARRQVEDIIFRRKNPTVADYCEKWLLMKSATISAASLKGYTSTMNQYIQKQQIAVQEVEQIEPHAVPFSSKVMLDRSEYENLAAAAKKFYVQERKESKLQKALDSALKMISELKAKVAALTAELAEYKSVRGQLNTAGLEQQNELLRNKLHRYETVIERNGLWNLFRPSTKTKDITRQEERL